MLVDRGRKAVRLSTAGLLVASLVLAGCSSDETAKGTGDKDTAKTTTTAGAAASGYTPPECDQGATTDEVETEPVAVAPSDLTLTSHDGTEIRMH